MSREQDDDLDRIDHAPFMFLRAGLNDVYEVIGKTSDAVQKHEIPPWVHSAIVQTYLTTLNTVVKKYQKREYKSCQILANKHGSPYSWVRRNHHDDYLDANNILITAGNLFYVTKIL